MAKQTPKPQPPNGEEDYSPSSTVILFDHPLPLLRFPIPASSSDDPSIGPFLLAFNNPQSFHSAFTACESKIVNQCEDGSRIGCAITASSKCKPPWWRSIFGVGGDLDLKERERCEEREMAICVAASKEKCVVFAKEKCLGPFRDARIAMNDKRVVAKKASKLIFCAMMVAKGTGWWSLVEIDQICKWFLADCEVEATNYRGSVLLDCHVE